jgi:hypothetical protein
MKTLRLLTIGNSFSENAMTCLPQLAATDGTVTFDLHRASLGGCTLEKHWNLADYTRQAPDYKSYHLKGEACPANLQEALTAQPWDFVTLQQASPKSWIRATYEPFLGNLLREIRTLAPTAEPLLHQTWAYRGDADFLADKGITQRYMFERIRENYDHFSAVYKLRLLRSGEAVQAARETPGHAFVWPDPAFNYMAPCPPALPDQTHSLIGGWRWAINGTADGRPELVKDVIHLNSDGCFLVGCLWFERLTGRGILANPFKPDTMNDATAAFLRGIAHTIAQQP